MKCYKRLMTFILLFYLGLSFAQTPESQIVPDKIYDSVLPLGTDNVIKNNEVYDVLIKSEKSNDELIAFKSKKINKIMFVMEFFEKNNQRLFRVFVTDPPEPKKNISSEDKKEDPIIFDRLGFDYRPVNPKSSQDFISYELPYEFMPNKTTLMKILTSLFFAMLVFPILWGVYRGGNILFRNRREKKRRKNKEKELIRFIEQVKDRNDFEKLYSMSTEIETYCEVDETEFKKLLKLIYQFQYMRSWSHDQIELLTRHLGNIMRIKSGI